MARAFLSFLRLFLLFILWAGLGAATYLFVLSLLSEKSEVVADPGAEDQPAFDSPGVPSNNPVPLTHDRPLEASPVVYARSEAPSDLAFDLAGNGFLLDESGLVRRIPRGATDSATEFLNLADEQQAGVGIPFSCFTIHPGFLNPESKGHGRFFAIVPEKAGTKDPDFIPEYANAHEHHQDVLYEFHTEDPTEEVFSGKRREILRLSQPGADHNMSGLAFDHRGYLFVSVGDGASGEVGRNTASRNAMSLANPYGKVLRIDPFGRNSLNGKYGIPRRNPLAVIDNAMPEIWCYGLRDPRGIQFDPFREWLCIGDTGAENLEEINISEYGGEHFGWDLCEGSFFFPPSEGTRPTEGVTAPQVEFSRRSDRVVGGFVYRGERFPTLAGKIIAATTGGRLIAAKAQPDESAGELKLISDPEENREVGARVSAIRPGPGGEIFILSSTGEVYELHKPVSAAKSKRHRKPLLASIR